MKNWLSIGPFSKKAGVSARALRVYEEVGLVRSQARGANGYRYYSVEQLEVIQRIKQFKSFGFSLNEVKTLLEADRSMDSEKLKEFLALRLVSIEGQFQNLFQQKNQIQNILSSMENTKTGLGPSERRYVMSQFERLSIVVTGVTDLELTAQHIGNHLDKAGQRAEVLVWNEEFVFPQKKLFVLIVPEKLLSSPRLRKLMPDVVVIRNLSKFSPEIQASYLNLYSAVGPHMTTVLNADDRLSLQLAANDEIRKGRIFYFSKNSGLESQIEKIGGVICDGEEMKVFGFNLMQTPLIFKISRLRAFDDEVALVASVAALLDVGLDQSNFPSSAF